MVPTSPMAVHYSRHSYYFYKSLTLSTDLADNGDYSMEIFTVISDQSHLWQ